jgi:hypothetical protein
MATRLGEPRSRPERCEEKENLPLPGIEPDRPAYNPSHSDNRIFAHLMKKKTFLRN